MDCEYVCSFLYTEFSWLSAGWVLQRLVELRQQVHAILLKAKSRLLIIWSTQLAKLIYLADIFGNLIELNLNLRGKYKISLHENHSFVYMCKGCTTAQVVSHWLLTTVAWIPFQVGPPGICSGQWRTGVGFLQGLQFPHEILIPPTVPHSIIILSSVLYSYYLILTPLLNNHLRKYMPRDLGRWICSVIFI
jgi:hypothetical protein